MIRHTPFRLRLGALAAAGAMALAVVPAVALAEGSSPQAALEMAHDELATIDHDHAAKAAKELGKVLDPKYWDETGQPSWKDGKKAFEAAAKAVEKLAKAEGLETGAGMTLLEAMRAAAVAAGADAGEKAAEKLAKGDAKASEGDPHKAIDEYRKAWEEAHKAAEKAAKEAEKAADEAAKATESKKKGGKGAFGTSHVYTFTFVNPATGATLVVSGSSGSNEGYLFSSAFGPEDTYMDATARAAAIAGAEAAGYPTGLPAGWDAANGGVMQVHVSCSDAFPGGYGAKSDPAPTATWLVANAHIDKESKSCDLVMIELPDPDPGGVGG